MLFDALLHKLEGELRASCDAIMASARTQLKGALGDIAQERAKGLDEVKKDRAKGLADVAKEKADLQREIAAMQKQQEAQQGRVVLDIGGYRYTTSVQTLRRLPGTFFDAYFSGRYTMDRSKDGSIFIDRDGKHFGQMLQYLRDGVVSAAEKDAAELDIGELRWLKREFGFYCIELNAELQEVYVVGGIDNDCGNVASMEGYDVASGAWREVAPMAIARAEFSLCKLSGSDLYATGGYFAHYRNFVDVVIASVERYDSSLDTWSAAPPLPRPRYAHCACAVGYAIYVLGGIEQDEEGGEKSMKSVLKFDCQMQTWNEVASIPEERDRAGACVLGSDVYIFGGRLKNSSTYRFNTETYEWVTLAPMPEASMQHSVSVLDGLMYVMGGEDDDDSIRSVHRFDPVANLWSALAPMLVPRTTLGSFVLGGNIYAVGGFDGEERLSSMERYSVSSDSWSEVLGGELGTARCCFGIHVIRSEIELFDSLIAKAKSE
jgi:kelch-like protein 17 (actinfilin)/kelch-like protein 20